MPDEIPVRQAGSLPPAFFRFPLTEDTLALGYVLGPITRTRDFHPLENAHTKRTTADRSPHPWAPVFFFSGKDLSIVIIAVICYDDTHEDEQISAHYRNA
jgi:hypothetical protein